jgi:hypothetical protein
MVAERGCPWQRRFGHHIYEQAIGFYIAMLRNVPGDDYQVRFATKAEYRIQHLLKALPIASTDRITGRGDMKIG